jgi:hypothetical protein
MGVLILAGIILYHFEPSHYSFYPQCVFHQATGLDCPGCGSLRALHQLLHGNLRAAFHYNPLLVSALPVAWIILVSRLWEMFHGRPTGFRVRPVWIWAGFFALVVFTIARNL